jgi:amino acid permease
LPADSSETDYDTQRVNPNGIGLVLAFFLNFRSYFGLAILTFPHMTQKVGYQAVLFTLPVLVTFLGFGADLVIQVADDCQYYGDSLETLVEKILGKAHQALTIGLNWFFNFSVSATTVIMAVKFVQFSMCQLGFCPENSRLWINLLGLCLCLPICFIRNLKLFKYLAVLALYVIIP